MGIQEMAVHIGQLQVRVDGQPVTYRSTTDCAASPIRIRGLAEEAATSTGTSESATAHRFFFPPKKLSAMCRR